jgi:hypothetical protein
MVPSTILFSMAFLALQQFDGGLAAGESISESSEEQQQQRNSTLIRIGRGKQMGGEISQKYHKHLSRLAK